MTKRHLEGVDPLDSTVESSVYNKTNDDKEDEEAFVDTAFLNISCDDGGKKRKFQKKRLAFLIGYNGKNYRGVQIQNKNVEVSKWNTVENVLFSALVKLGMITEENSKDPGKVYINRASRTDKGVHALLNIVSIKCLLVEADLEILRDLVSKELPDDIQLYAIQRVPITFSAKNNCHGRIYDYILPTFLLRPPDVELFEKVFSDYQSATNIITSSLNTIKTVIGSVKEMEPDEDVVVDYDDDDDGPLEDFETDGNKTDFVENNNNDDHDDKMRHVSSRLSKTGVFESIFSPEVIESLIVHLKKIRLTQEEQQKVQNLLSEYVGTHSYHNFTLACVAKDHKNKKEAKLPGWRRNTKHQNLEDNASIKNKGTLQSHQDKLLNNDTDKQEQNQNPQQPSRLCNDSNETKPLRHDSKNSKLRRYIKSFKISKPYVQDDIECVTLTVEGQSFILHQIRKMVGLVVMIMQGILKDDITTKKEESSDQKEPIQGEQEQASVQRHHSIFQRVFDSDYHLSIPKVPGLSLILRSMDFTIFNERKGSIHGNLRVDEMDFLEKKSLILKDVLKYVIKEEKTKGNFIRFLTMLNVTTAKKHREFEKRYSFC